MAGEIGKFIRSVPSTALRTAAGFARETAKGGWEGGKAIGDFASDNMRGLMGLADEPSALAKQASSTPHTTQQEAGAKDNKPHEQGSVPVFGRLSSGGAPNMGAARGQKFDPSEAYAGGNSAPDSGSGGMGFYDTPKNPGSLGFIDRGGPDAPYTHVGLRQRAMQQAPEFPDLQQYTKNYTPSAPDNYGRPHGGAESYITKDPLLSLSAGQLAQDEGVRQEREGRYGGIRQAALAQDEDELKRLQLSEQMKDPLGITREMNTLRARAENSPEAQKLGGAQAEKDRQLKVIKAHADYMAMQNDALRRGALTQEQYNANKENAELQRDMKLGPDFLKAMRKPEDPMMSAAMGSAAPQRP